MKLMITIVSNGRLRPLDVDGWRAGINLLDRAREFTRIPDLPPESVDDFVDGESLTFVDVEVTEAIARKSGLFANSSRVRVVVPPHSLNKYLAEEPYLGIVNDDGKRKIMVRWRSFIQYDKIARDWSEAGCPVEWNP